MARTTEDVVQSRQVVREKIKALRQWMREKWLKLKDPSLDLSQHISNKNNPHNNDKSTVDLELVQNYPPADDEDILNGDSLTTYVLSSQVSTLYDAFDETGDEGSYGLYRPTLKSPNGEVVQSPVMLTTNGVNFNEGKKALDDRYAQIQTREYQVKRVDETWASAITETTDNDDPYQWTGSLDDTVQYEWRCRDTNAMGQTTNWSEPKTFTYNLVVGPPITIVSPPSASEHTGDITITINDTLSSGSVLEVSDTETFDTILYTDGSIEGSTAVLPVDQIGEGVRYIRIAPEGSSNYHVVSYVFNMDSVSNVANSGARLTVDTLTQHQQLRPYGNTVEHLTGDDVIVYLGGAEVGLMRYNIKTNTVVWAKKIAVSWPDHSEIKIDKWNQRIYLSGRPMLTEFYDEDADDQLMESVKASSYRNASTSVLTFDYNGVLVGYLQNKHILNDNRVLKPFLSMGGSSSVTYLSVSPIDQPLVDNDYIGFLRYGFNGAINSPFVPLLKVPASKNIIPEFSTADAGRPWKRLINAKIMGPVSDIQVNRDTFSIGVINVFRDSLPSIPAETYVLVEDNENDLRTRLAITLKDQLQFIWTNSIHAVSTTEYYLSGWVMGIDTVPRNFVLRNKEGVFTTTFLEIPDDPNSGSVVPHVLDTNIWVDESDGHVYLMTVRQVTDTENEILTRATVLVHKLDPVEFDLIDTVQIDTGDDHVNPNSVVVTDEGLPYYVLDVFNHVDNNDGSRSNDGKSRTVFVPVPLDMSEKLATEDTMIRIKKPGFEINTTSTPIIDLSEEQPETISDSTPHQLNFTTTTSTNPPALQVIEDADMENIEIEKWSF
jgi:hypothetical protein